jgi:peptidoglycan/LPS O-acetylase OafA/YrhL
MPKASGRLYLLDIVRGLASLAVVVWHYQHFFFVAPATLSADFVRTDQPFYRFLSLFYNEGSRAVYLFFVLSGFVFFYQYADDIRLVRIRASDFFVLRFSRLYPLHALTLVIVAIGQAISYDIHGQYIVYPCNDLKRSILSTLLLTDWLPMRYVCNTLNAPTWSVSVEAFLYLVFFLFARLLPSGFAGQLFVTAAAVIAGIAVHELNGFHLLGEPVTCFFAGGVASLIWKRSDRDPKSSRWLLLISTSVAATSILCVISFGPSVLLLDVALYPSAILALAFFQTFHSKAGRPLRAIGDISYSTYLIHFPLQLIILLTFSLGMMSFNFYDPPVFAMFFFLLFFLSCISYYGFERPAQQAIRKRMLSSSSNSSHG